MKILIGAIALFMGAPAAAQVAQTTNPHAGHTPQQHEQHKQQSGHQHGQHQQGGHADHKMGCCKDGHHGACCDKAKQGQKMPCCAEHGERHGSERKGHQH